MAGAVARRLLTSKASRWFANLSVVGLNTVCSAPPHTWPALQASVSGPLPLFWRFHMMHHADLDCDVTTGLTLAGMRLLPFVGAPGNYPLTRQN